MVTLRVSPWEYSSIRKNAYDLTEGEFIQWMLEKWPFLINHQYEQIDIVVDYENGSPASVWDSVASPHYVLVFRSHS